MPVVPQGARTGLAGGANAIDGGLVLSLTRMDQILDLDPVEQLAVVQPGVVNVRLQDAAAEEGLFYPPDPSSFRECTLGGNLATGAGGLRCVKYGVTRDAVRALEVVLAGGEVLRTGTPTAKGVAGYDLTRLMVGSEGTLGVITEATLGAAAAAGAGPDAGCGLSFCRGRDDGCRADHGRRPATGTPRVPRQHGDPRGRRTIATSGCLGMRARCCSPSRTGVRAPPTTWRPWPHGAPTPERPRRQWPRDETESELLLEARRLVHWGVDALGSTLVEDVCVPRGATR